jgi:hypothetical protein
MSVFYICGKPGGGKTYIGVKQICEELADPNSNRFIVTGIRLESREGLIFMNLPATTPCFGWIHMVYVITPIVSHLKIQFRGVVPAPSAAMLNS